MLCPRCSARDTRVIDSRLGKNGDSIRRRRQCPECNYRFTTFEEILREDLAVLKSNGRVEAFDRSKMANGIRKACEKRPIDPEQIEMLISDVMVELESEFDDELPAKAIGERVLIKLKGIDPIAYVRFASVYKDFRDLSEMEREISELNQKNE